jgi:hypothetical protein
MAQAPLVPANWQLPDVIRRRLGKSVGMQRVMFEEGHLVIIAHEVPKVSEDTRHGILFWRDPQGEWRCSNGDPGTVGIENLLQRYDKRVDEFDIAEARAKSADEYLRLIEGLTPVSRAAQHLHAVLQESRKLVPEAVELIDLRNRAYEISRTAELQYQYTRDEMDVAVIRRSEEHVRASDRMAKSAHRLNLMAAFFLPLATVSGVFGTTLTENWSWSESALPFALMLLTGLAAGGILTLMLTNGKTQK